SEDRAIVLSLANDSRPWLVPEEGAEIVIPYNLRVIVRPGETLSTIAGRFLGNPNKAWKLDQYNKFEGRPVEPGTAGLVPLTDSRLPEGGGGAGARDAEGVAQPAAGDTRRMQRRIAQAMPPWISEVRAGRYVDAAARGGRLIARGALAEPQLAAV